MKERNYKYGGVEFTVGQVSREPCVLRMKPVEALSDRVYEYADLTDRGPDAIDVDAGDPKGKTGTRAANLPQALECGAKFLLLTERDMKGNRDAMESWLEGG